MALGRMVLLRHDTPDGAHHYDWMVQRVQMPKGAPDETPPDAKVLITFRLLDRIDTDNCDKFEADRLGDHRYAYLSFEGTLTQNRGTVKRIAHGVVRHVDEMPGGGAISIRAKWFGGKERVWAGVKQGDLWSFRRGQPVLIESKPAERSADTGDLGDILTRQISPHGFGGGLWWP